jgi:hypothetical protein
MEDILYLSKKPVDAQDVILVAKHFNYNWDVMEKDAATPCAFEVRIIPFKGTYWDFTNFEGSPDFQCLENDDLNTIRKYAASSIFIVTHSYDTRAALLKFLKKLIEQKGGGVVTDGDFAHVDELY